MFSSRALNSRAHPMVTVDRELDMGKLLREKLSQVREQRVPPELAAEHEQPKSSSLSQSVDENQFEEILPDSFWTLSTGVNPHTNIFSVFFSTKSET